MTEKQYRNLRPSALHVDTILLYSCTTRLVHGYMHTVSNPNSSRMLGRYCITIITKSLFFGLFSLRLFESIKLALSSAKFPSGNIQVYYSINETLS